MAAVLETVLKKGSKAKEATDSYIDDIMVDVTKISTKEVVEHLKGFGLIGCDMVEKKNDYNHINVAELDAVLKSINLAIKWGLREIEIRTDSAMVLSWVTSTVEKSGRIRTKSAGEVIVKRRLGILGELISEFKLQIKAVFVPSERNKADAPTWIKKQWLVEKEEVPVCCLGIGKLEELHGMNYMGVERTLYLVQKVDPHIKQEEVQKVVKNCVRCQPINWSRSKCTWSWGNWDFKELDKISYRHYILL